MLARDGKPWPHGGLGLLSGSCRSCIAFAWSHDLKGSQTVLSRTEFDLGKGLQICKRYVLLARRAEGFSVLSNTNGQGGVSVHRPRGGGISCCDANVYNKDPVTGMAVCPRGSRWLLVLAGSWCSPSSTSLSSFFFVILFIKLANCLPPTPLTTATPTRRVPGGAAALRCWMRAQTRLGLGPAATWGR